MKLRRPDKSEHVPYFSRYIDLVTEENILDAMERAGKETQTLLASVDESRAGHRYAPDKWSIRQVVGHIDDCERVFAYRALTFARGDKSPLPGFDEKAWMADATFDSAKLRDLARGLAATRAATLQLFRLFDDGAWDRSGVANESPISVRALAYIVVGHERHHIRILRERYLQAVTA